MKSLAAKMVWTFLALTLVLCGPLYYLLISRGGFEGDGVVFIAGLMWAPGVAALLTRLLYQRNLRGMGWGWGPSRYQAASYFTPVVAGLLVYGTVWLAGIGEFTGRPLTSGLVESLGGSIVLMASLGVLGSLILALGEEIGWRGLLVPELAKVTSYTKLSLISAVIWSLYHYPGIFLADYSSAAPTWYAALMFSASMLGVSFLAAWLRLKSGSLWTGAILHASHNLFIQGIFDPLTLDTGRTQYITTEFGAGMALCYLVAGGWCWWHRADLPKVAQTA